MGSRIALVVLVGLLLAGCASDAPPGRPTGPSGTASPTPPPAYGPAPCANALLFEVVDYSQVDPYLPPGFHPRDPQAFLNSPAAFGQAGVVFLALDCESAASGPLEAAFVGIFIEAPIVDGVEPAPFNFLELVRYTSSAEFGGALAQAGWPVVAANVTLQAVAPELQEFDAQLLVEDAEGTVAMVAGTVGAPAGAIGAGPTRFWHQDAGGLSYIEYGAALEALVGSGVCQARQGTPLSAFVGAPIGGFSCLGVTGGEPIVAVLQGLDVNATFQHLPGARAA